MNPIYLDHNATTPLHPDVKCLMHETLDMFGNPSSMHVFGRAAREKLEKARDAIAAFIGADADEIIFVGSGSEANNTVLSLLSCSHCACALGNDPEIITTRIEHPCILETAQCIAGRGVKVHYVDVDAYGKIDIEQLKSFITVNTRIVSVMMANNEIGTIQDIDVIARLVHEKGALFHTDAVQAAGKIPVDVKALDVDFLTLSAHKMYGPKGVGALYIKKNIPFCPLIRGGHQERGRRAGTENTLGIMGFAEAVRMRTIEMAAEEVRLKAFRKKIIAHCTASIPHVHINGHLADVLANTVNISFPGAEGEAILLYLDLEGIAVSTGSACASGSLDPSHVLLATGLGPEKAHGSIRISMGRGTTAEEIDYLLEKLPPVIARIRAMSTTTAVNPDITLAHGEQH